MIAKLWIYVVALLTLRGAVSGGVVAFVLQVLKKLFNWEPGKRLWIWAFLVFGFVISAFLAWQEEYDRARPKLALTVGRIVLSRNASISDGQATRNFKFVVIVPASVSNVGIQRTVAEDYGLEISIPGQAKSLQTNWLVLAAKNDPINIQGQEIPPSRFLDKETLVPIEIGDQKTGILLFSVETGDGLSVQDTFPTGTIFTLSCTDVGNNVTISPPHVLTGTFAPTP